MQTCISCNSQYDQAQKASVLRQAEQSQSAEQKQRALRGRFTPLAIKYPQTCLSCINAELALTKQQYQSNLKASAIKLAIARKTLSDASAKHTSLINNYESPDEQQAYITFWVEKAKQAKAQAASKARTSKTRTSKSKVPSVKAQTDLISSLLKQLSPEQQKAIIQAGLSS
jgi:hypothetical protein